MQNNLPLLLAFNTLFACTTPPPTPQNPTVTKPNIEPAAVCKHMDGLFEQSNMPANEAAKEKERCVPTFAEHRQDPCYEPFASCLLSKQTLEEAKSCREIRRVCETEAEAKTARDKEEKRTAALCPKLEQFANKPKREGGTPPGYVRKPFRKETCPRDANSEWGPFLIACAEIAYDWEYYSYCKDKMIHPTCIDFIDEVEQICEDPSLPEAGKSLCKEPQEAAQNLRGGSMPEPPGADSDIYCKDDATRFATSLQQAKKMLQK